MKILTICSAGTVRSVAMAHVLKYDYEHDAVAAGYDTNSPETFKMLADWADLILPMTPGHAKALPKGVEHKTHVLDIGPDIWSNPLHPSLQGRLKLIAFDLREKRII